MISCPPIAREEMELKSINYSQYDGELDEWRLEGLELGRVNLLVSSNAVGKTRTLNVINGLAALLSGRVKLRFRSGNYDTRLEHDGKVFQYVLEYRDAQVVREEFRRNKTEVLLQRGEGGAGKIFAEKIGGLMEFQTPEDELAAVARRDTVQHSFLDPLTQWANSTYHYAFGSDMGKNRFAAITGSEKGEFDPHNTEAVVVIFKKGQEDFGDRFEKAIRQDMESIGYCLDHVNTDMPSSVTIRTPLGAEVVGLYAKETDLKGETDQHNMSQGMFRAFSIIIQLNYLLMGSKPSCILIDDIGEGLDFERSCALIELLIEKVEGAPVQLVMATNDRFVMNKVPLEVWSVLQREPGVCRVRNYANSKDLFDEFKFTGMNNFDFFACDYLNREHQVNE